MLAHGRCERVARERAGGERGFIFACQKENRVPPSNKAASEVPAATLRRVLNAGRRNSKDRLQTRLHRCVQEGGTGEGGAFPRKVRRAHLGVRGGARLAAPESPAFQPGGGNTEWRSAGCAVCVCSRRARAVPGGASVRPRTPPIGVFLWSAGLTGSASPIPPRNSKSCPRRRSRPLAPCGASSSAKATADESGTFWKPCASSSAKATADMPGLPCGFAVLAPARVVVAD